MRRIWLAAGVVTVALIVVLLLVFPRRPPAIQALNASMDRLASALREFPVANGSPPPVVGAAQKVSGICFIAKQIDKEVYNVGAQLKSSSPETAKRWRSLLRRDYDSRARRLRTEIERIKTVMKQSADRSGTRFGGAKLSDRGELYLTGEDGGGGLQTFFIEQFCNADIDALLKNSE